MSNDNEIREQHEYFKSVSRQELARIFNSRGMDSDRVNGHKLTRNSLAEALLGNYFKDVDITINDQTGELTIGR